MSINLQKGGHTLPTKGGINLLTKDETSKRGKHLPTNGLLIASGAKRVHTRYLSTFRYLATFLATYNS